MQQQLRISIGIYAFIIILFHGPYSFQLFLHLFSPEALHCRPIIANSRRTVKISELFVQVIFMKYFKFLFIIFSFLLYKLVINSKRIILFYITVTDELCDVLHTHRKFQKYFYPFIFNIKYLYNKKLCVYFFMFE